MAAGFAGLPTSKLPSFECQFYTSKIERNRIWALPLMTQPTQQKLATVKFYAHVARIPGQELSLAVFFSLI